MVSPWREQLSTGSYKGAEFYTESHSFEGGKRIVDHVFPYRNNVWTEDLGLKQRVFSIEMYLVGEDYFGQRDNLIEAFESPGSGVLVHPYLGTKTVECESFTVSETKTEGGLVKFSVTFRETGRKPGPELFNDPSFVLEDLSKTVPEQAARDFTGFDVSGLSELGLQRAVALVDKGTQILQNTTNSFPGNFGVAELGYSIRDMKERARDLVRTPGQLASKTIEAVAGLVSAIGFAGLDPADDRSPQAEQDAVISGREQRHALRGLIDFPSSLPRIEGDTPSKVVEQENQRLFANLIKITALSQLSLISAKTQYATYDEALVQRNYLVSEIQELLEDATLSDESYSALMDLMANVVKAIPSVLSEEARITRIEIPQSMPSLVTTYELYGKLNLEQDLVLRNRVKNPGFVSAGTIEVIAGG